MLFTQTPLWQSVVAEQILPGAHVFAGAHVPPQSTSVSAWFFTESLHVGVWQLGGVPVQTLLVQSLAPAHFIPEAHFGHDEPQSTSVSVPFMTLSVHVGV
jgi:hypothetical protein